MASDLFRFDDSHNFRRKKTNYFAWTILILLLIGLVFAAWLGSFYVFGQPERLESYHLLQKLHKIEPPKRFALTAAPPGEFLNPRQLFARYSAMGPEELRRKDAELTRNFIRNYQQVHGLVTYVVGRFNIMSARELTRDDMFSPGAVALARAVQEPELLMEHIFTTADEHDAKLLTPMLVTGMDLNFERTHDLSAVIHAERLPDGRIQISAIPLLYGSYAMTRGSGTYSLEPPTGLNLAAGWPLFKDDELRVAETHYDKYRQKLAPVNGSVAIAGLPPVKSTPSPITDALVRVELAAPAETATPPVIATASRAQRLEFAQLSQAKKTLGTPIVRRAEPAPEITPPTLPNDMPVATAVSASPPPKVMRALPIEAPSPTPAVALASTTGATWKTFTPGQMPVGRLIDARSLHDVAKNGTRGERIYLRGQFVVNFADGNRAVLRPTGGVPDSINLFSHKPRIIVDYPAGAPLPEPGSTLERDASRPFEITEVREQSDGQLNVFVREIIKPSRGQAP